MVTSHLFGMCIYEVRIYGLCIYQVLFVSDMCVCTYVSDLICMDQVCIHQVRLHQLCSCSKDAYIRYVYMR